jgi:hypothetical protein
VFPLIHDDASVVRAEMPLPFLDPRAESGRVDDVFVDSMAPTTRMPVYNPRSGIASHEGCAARVGEVRRCCSRSTRKRCSRRSRAGYADRGAAAVLRDPRPAKMVTQDTPMLARKKPDVNEAIA